MDPSPKTNGVNQQELMIWFNKQGEVNPISFTYDDGGAVPIATVTIAGISWNVYQGYNGANNVVSYVALTPITSLSFDVLDFVADTSQTADFDSISSLLPSASQIELVITKAAGTNIIGASYTLLNAFNVSVGGGVLDNINNVTLGALSVYNGENFTRAQFFSTDTGVPIPAPAPFATLLIGLAGLGYARRKRAA